LGIFECSASQKTELTRILGELEILSSQAQGNLDYSDAQKAQLKEGVLEVKTLVNGLLSCCVASSPNGRVAAGTCEPTSTIQAKTQTRISELQNFPKPSFSPYVIAQTRRRPGKADNLVDIADDLKHGDFTILDELISVNDNFRRLLVSPYFFDKNYNDPNVLKQEWINLNNQATMNDIEMRNVANLMTEKVFSGNGGVSYSFSVLNQRAEVCGSTNNLIENIKTSLEFELKKDPNFISKKGKLRLITNGNYNSEGRPDGNGPIKERPDDPTIARDDIPSPIYGSNCSYALAITINDTWAQDIVITHASIDKIKRTYSVTLDFKIYDHYGLNIEDIQKESFRNDFRFLSWFLLQRWHLHDKKPFITEIKFNKTINGNY